MSRTSAVTIVMIEDDPGHARLIEKNVRRASVPNEIRAFIDGGSALSFLEGPENRDGNCLILLDLNLPDMRGIEVLRRIKTSPRLRLYPVIILTTTDDEEEIRQCYELGANVYVTKPLDFEGFANAVRQLGLLFTIMQVAPMADMRPPVARVLYVDDDMTLVRLVQKALAREGFAVAHAATGEAALEMVMRSAADAVVLDHYLPSGTGLEVLAQLAALEGAPPVVYVTGSTETAVAVAALKAGAADFVPKTVGEDFLALLTAALRQALAKHRLEGEKRAAERAVRVARDRAEALLHEVNHRVANSLSLVAALIDLQLRATKNPAIRDALVETQSRINAVGLVHKRLYSSGEVGVVDLREYLSGLLKQLASSMKGQGFEGSLVYDLEPALLRTDSSINLGVIVTEWVNNAYKYAYPDGAGQVTVSLKREGGTALRLTVKDDGIGVDTLDEPKGTGLGTRIVASMARTMDATIECRDRTPGAEFSIAFAEDGLAYVGEAANGTRHSAFTDHKA